MKKLYTNLKLLAVGVLAVGTQLQAQTGCAITQTSNLHQYGCGVGDQIDSYVLNGIAANNAGCANNNYVFYNNPTWNLIIGNSYTWAATVGGQWSYDQGLAIWIDLNNDGFFTSNEQVGNSAPATSHSGTFTIPFGSSAGQVRMRLRCDYWVTIPNTNQTACDQNFYYGETEDYIVNLISPTPCSGTPAANSVISPTAGICPNESAYLSLGTTYTVGDITYQWQASTTSSVGPFTSVPNATNSSFSTPNLTGNTWYQTIITCTASSQSITSAPGLVMVQGVTTNSVPYHEGFEGITAQNKLPNCSWDADNLGTEALTYKTSNTGGRNPRNGNSFASFYYSPSGVKRFYSNGIQLEANVTYSASVWYQTEYYGYNNWTDLSLLAGPNQNSTGQFTIASTNGPAISPVYKALSNTFTVPTSGIYYIEVRGTGGTSSSAQWLSWDDLEVIIPCDLNTPAVSLTPSQTICAGADVNIAATGADMYSWNTGATGASLNDKPFNSTLYTVTGTNTLTGCSATAQHYVQVNPTPQVGIFANKTGVCPGGSAVLTAFGADMYTWSNNAMTNITTVSPAATTSYSVFGTNSFNCQGMAVQQITVFDAPVVNASVEPTEICPGQQALLTGTGADSYQWVSANSYNQSNPAAVTPNSSTSYTVTGTDANGCKGTQFVSVTVLDCTSLTEYSGAEGITVFPNPNTGVFVVKTHGETTVVVSDVTGRIVASVKGADNTEVNISELSNGIYNVQVRTNDAVKMIKIVKE